MNTRLRTEKMVVLDPKDIYYCKSCKKLIDTPLICLSNCMLNFCAKCALPGSVCPQCKANQLDDNGKLVAILEKMRVKCKLCGDEMSFGEWKTHPKTSREHPQKCGAADLGCTYKSHKGMDAHERECRWVALREGEKYKEELAALRKQLEVKEGYIQRLQKTRDRSEAATHSGQRIAKVAAELNRVKAKLVELVPVTELFVTGLPQGLEAEDLKDVFAEFHPLDVKIATEPEGKSKGFAFISFPSQEEAKRALQELNECEVNGSRLKLQVSLRSDHLLRGKPNTNSNSNPNPAQPPHENSQENSLLFDFLLSSAQPEDLLSFAQRYQNGDGVATDFSKARLLYEQLSELDNDEGINGLAVLYHQGLGVEQNLVKSVELFRRAAEKGNSSALCNMGNMFFAGMAVEKNLQTAREFYEKAAENGNSEALYNLGLLYEHGFGVEKDHQKGIHYFKLSAEKGNTLAIQALENFK